MAVSSHGTLLKIGDGASPEVFTTIGEVKDISGPGMQLNTEDVTNHDSNGWREYVATVKEATDITFDINYTMSVSQEALVTDLKADVLRNFKIEWTTTPAKTTAFAAFVTGFEISAPVEGALTASVTLKPQGAYTTT